MSTASKVDLFRVFLTRNHGAEFLVEFSPQGTRLPVVAIPSHTRPAQELTEAIEQRWSIKAYCLFVLTAKLLSDLALPTAVLEICPPCSMVPDGMQWLPVLSLARTHFDDPESYGAAERALETIDGFRSGELMGPFGRTGWLGNVTEWVEAQAATFNLRLTGAFCQLNASATFSLIRFETDGPNLWFKAVGEPNLREYPITLALVKRFPEYLPIVVAARPDWNAWLAIEAEGAHLDADSTLDEWTTVINRLANLEIASFGHTRHILDSGARDARLFVLHGLLDAFVEDAAAFTEHERSIFSKPLPRGELRLLCSEIRRCLELLESWCLPNVLGHFDFNPTNIVLSGQHCVFLDWAEACVGPPILTLAGALESFEAFGNRTSDARDRLISQFISCWSAFESPANIKRAIEVSSLTGLFARFVTSTAWTRRRQFANPNLGESLQKYLRRMQRAFKRQSHGRIACLT